MNRVSFVVLFVAAVSLPNARARAEVPVAPPPREIRPDGTRDPVPKAERPAKGEDPAVTVKRIIDNSKEVGDKLAKTDTGTDTRKTQGKILSDIDALINQQENPPPPQPDKDKEKDKQDMGDKKDMKDPMMDPGMKKDGMPMGKDGMDMMPMPKGMGMGDPPPMGGMGERKPRMGDPMNDSKKEPNGNAKEPSKPDNDPTKKSGTPKDPTDPAGTAGGNPMGKAGIGNAALPFEESVAKDVWGHLPYKIRQQMSQYYKDEFTPKYAELLRLYYSSLSDKGTKPEKK